MYPAYKLIRAVNRQYPNNGFINYVDVNEDNYNGQLIDEDLRDIINEALSETYIHIARDEVYTFPTVPGQREYALPDDCDLRDVQEVVRRGARPPWPGMHNESGTRYITFFSNGGTGRMEKVEVEYGSTYTLPINEFRPPENMTFKCWEIGGHEYYVGDTIGVYSDLTVTPVWRTEPVSFTIQNITPADLPMYLHFAVIDGREQIEVLAGNGGEYTLELDKCQPLRSKYSTVYVIDYYSERRDVDMTTPITEDKVVKFTQSTIGDNGSDTDWTIGGNGGNNSGGTDWTIGGNGSDDSGGTDWTVGGGDNNSGSDVGDDFNIGGNGGGSTGDDFSIGGGGSSDNGDDDFTIGG